MLQRECGAAVAAFSSRAGASCEPPGVLLALFGRSCDGLWRSLDGLGVVLGGHCFSLFFIFLYFTICFIISLSFFIAFPYFLTFVLFFLYFSLFFFSFICFSLLYIFLLFFFIILCFFWFFLVFPWSGLWRSLGGPGLSCLHLGRSRSRLRRSGSHLERSQGGLGRCVMDVQWDLKGFYAQNLIVLEICLMFSNLWSVNFGFPTVWSRKLWFRKVREVYSFRPSKFCQKRMVWCQVMSKKTKKIRLSNSRLLKFERRGCPFPPE